MGTTNTTPEFAQGARCGHIEGKDRAGAYVLGEEEPLAYEAAVNQKLPFYKQEHDWAAGYRHGYRRAAEGEPLEAEYRL